MKHEPLPPVRLHPGGGGLVRKFLVLDRHLRLRAALRREPEQDRRTIGPRDAHRLVALRGPDHEIGAVEPPGAGAFVAERAIQLAEGHGIRAALARFVPAAPPLPDLPQALDALIAHSHGLRPPAWHLVFLAHVFGDRAVRPVVGPHDVERPHPLLPGAARLRLDGLVGHAGEPCVVGGSRGGAPGLFGLFPEEVRTSRGVGLARLLHARADDALEILVDRHRMAPLVRPRPRAPRQQQAMAAQRVLRYRSGSLPPFASRGPLPGRGRRGWAGTTALCAYDAARGWFVQGTGQTGQTGQRGR